MRRRILRSAVATAAGVAMLFAGAPAGHAGPPPLPCQGSASLAIQVIIRIDFNGAPLGDMPVSLSGPLGCTGEATTNANGRARFSGLGTGTYTATPSHAGCGFQPPSRTVNLKGRNVRTSFRATCV